MSKIGREMIRPIIVAAMLAAFVLAACGEGALPPIEEAEVRTRGLTEPEQVSLEALPQLGTQVSLGQPITVDASVLPGIIGAPPLSGQLVLDFLWTERGPVVEDRIRPLVVGATFKPIEAHEGEFLVVHYTVENKTDGIFLPSCELDRGKIHKGFSQFQFKVQYAAAKKNPN